MIHAIQFSCWGVFDFLWPHGLEHARLTCPLPTPRARSNSCPLTQWCHPAISSSVIPFSSCLQSFPASGSFPMSQFFATGSQSTGASAAASVLPVNIQDWSPFWLTYLNLLMPFSWWLRWKSFCLQCGRPGFHSRDQSIYLLCID